MNINNIYRYITSLQPPVRHALNICATYIIILYR